MGPTRKTTYVWFHGKSFAGGPGQGRRPPPRTWNHFISGVKRPSDANDFMIPMLQISPVVSVGWVRRAQRPNDGKGRQELTAISRADPLGTGLYQETLDLP